MKRRKKKTHSIFRNTFGAVFGFLGHWGLKVFPWVAGAAIIALAFYGVRGSLFADPFFRLEMIRIQTDGMLSPDEIRTVAGVKAGQNLLCLDIAKVAEKLKTDSRIRSAWVERLLPNQIEIQVRERKGFLKVKTPFSETPQIISYDGFYLGAAPEDSLIPLFQDLRPEAKDLFGQKNYKDRKMLSLISSVREGFLKEPLFAERRLLGIDVYASHRIDLVWEGDLNVRVGKDWKKNLEKLAAIRPELEPDLPELEYLDLRFKDVIAKKRDKKKMAKGGKKNA
ncbi:MAG TPA: FtsQ-type POTRA domain-containing protein [Candidatus Omnitrophota bacterium]|nr:FtsQ-type POTRA domain-containing protein [Candidatus Omnitrophota bacterium]